MRSESGIGDLVDRHYAELFAYLYRLLYDREQAEALAQETFLRTYAARDRPARAGGQRLWLFRTASRLAGATGVSRLGRWTRADLAIRSEPTTLPILAWGVPGPVERALAGLPVRDRALVLLVRRYGMSLAEAGWVLGLGERVARQRFTAASEALRRACEPRAETGPVHAALLPLLAGAPIAASTEKAQADAHVAACAECRGRLAADRRVDAGLEGLPEPWPDRRAPAMLAAAMRRGDISDYDRLAVARPALVSPRLTRVAAVLLALAVAAGLWASAGRGLGRMGQTAPTSTAAPPAAPTATPVPPTPAPRSGEAGPDAVAWLQSNAVPFTSVEPGGKLADLEPLAGMIGDVRVVALDDDSDFGSHEAQAFRQRLLEMLVDEKGFSNLVLQVDWASGELLDQYIQGSGVDPVQALDQVRQSRGLAGGVWQTQEMLYTLRWLRAHNERLPEDQRFRIHGFLPIERPSNVPRTVVVDYLQRVDPGSTERAYGDHAGLVAFLRDHREQYTTRSQYADYRRAVSAAQVLAQYDRIANEFHVAERAGLYDSAALENLIGIAEQAGTAGKGIVWTASLPASGLPAVENLLQSVRRQPGGAVNLTFSIGQGSLYLVGKSEPEPAALSNTIQNQYGRPASSRLAEYRLPPAALDTYEDYFGHAGRPSFLLDLRRGYGDAPATGWLRGSHFARSIAANYWDCFPEDYYRQSRVSMSYDVVVYFDQVTPATLLSRPPVLPNANCPKAPIPIDLREGVHGWTTEGDPIGFSFGTGYAPGRAGTLAAFIGSEQSGSRGALTQSFRADAYRGRRVRLSLRTLAQGGDVRADLWLGMTGLGGETLTSVTKPVPSGSGWQPLEILVDVPVEASRISFGVKLRAPGWVWFTDQKFEVEGVQTAE